MDESGRISRELASFGDKHNQRVKGEGLAKIDSQICSLDNWMVEEGGSFNFILEKFEAPVRNPNRNTQITISGYYKGKIWVRYVDREFVCT